MAIGIFKAQVVLDTASDPDDTVVIAAPGASQTIHIFWMMIAISVGQTGARIDMEDGLAGTIIVSVPAENVNTHFFRLPRDSKLLDLSSNTLLNASIVGATGVVATATVGYRVRGN